MGVRGRETQQWMAQTVEWLSIVKASLLDPETGTNTDKEPEEQCLGSGSGTGQQDLHVFGASRVRSINQINGFGSDSGSFPFLIKVLT
jgi:hypothetical protein